MTRTDVKRILVILGSALLVAAVLVGTLVRDRYGATLWEYATGSSSYWGYEESITDASTLYLTSIIGLSVAGVALLAFGLGMSTAPRDVGPGPWHSAPPHWHDQQYPQQMPPMPPGQPWHGQPPGPPQS